MRFWNRPSANSTHPQIVYWLNMPSPHQEDLLQEIDRKSSEGLLVIYSSNLRADRAAQGWAVDILEYESVLLNGVFRPIRAAILAFRLRNAFHVFGGVWTTVPNFFGSLVLFLTRSNYAVSSEAPARVFQDDVYAPQTSGTRSILRSAIEWVSARTILRGARGVLAISTLAEEWYSRLNVPDENIYKFGYFRSLPANLGASPVEHGPQDLVYVGTDHHRKGFDILVEALEPLWEDLPSMRLLVAGAPSSETSLFAEGVVNQPDGRIVYLGAVQSESIFALMSGASLVVVPSRFDGWGMAISEALMVGVPVVASDRCGASDLIDDEVNGMVFRSGDRDALRAAIQSALSMKTQFSALRAFAADAEPAVRSPQDWYLLEISAPVENCAVYVLECIRHMVSRSNDDKPVPHWLPPITAMKVD